MGQHLFWDNYLVVHVGTVPGNTTAQEGTLLRSGQGVHGVVHKGRIVHQGVVVKEGGRGIDWTVLRSGRLVINEWYRCRWI